MKQLRLLCAVFLLVCLAVPARADDASKREKVHELFAVLHVDRNVQQLLDGTMKQVTAMTKQMMGNKKLPPDTETKLDEFQKRVMDLVAAQVSWEKLEPEYTELYMQTYTEQELDDILAFYRSPSGASMIAKTPELLSKSMAFSQQRMQAMMPQLIQMLQEFAKEVAPVPAGSSTAR